MCRSLLQQCRQSALHQSDNQQTALADCPTDVDAVISTYTIRRETSNPTEVRFHRIVEIQPDLDSRIGYPSIPSHTMPVHRFICVYLHVFCVFLFHTA